MTNYEKAKKEGIETLKVMTQQTQETSFFKIFLSSFAEKIKEAVENDCEEAALKFMKQNEPSSKTIKEK